MKNINKKGTRALTRDKFKLISSSKRSQEEMVGFVLIMIVVAVIALVFLGIFMKQEPKLSNSREATNFLYSSLLYTTECKPEQNRAFYNLREAITESSIIDCYGTNKEVKLVVKETFTKLIEKSFSIGSETRYSAYELVVYFGNDKIVEVKKGTKAGSMTGAIITNQADNFNISLRLWEN